VGALALSSERQQLDRPAPVRAGQADGRASALLFQQWTADLVLFVHTAPPPMAEQAGQLAARGTASSPVRWNAWRPPAGGLLACGCEMAASSPAPRWWSGQEWWLARAY
jgi:hypothetical protein